MVSVLAAMAIAPSLMGSFFQGNGMGVNLTMTFKESGKVDFRFQGCFGGHSRSGTYKVANEKVTLSFDLSRKDSYLASEYNIVRWDQAVFLVAEDEIAHFAQTYRKGWRGQGEPWGLSDFFRSDANRKVEKPVGVLKGTPQLPQKFLPLLKRDIAGKVTSVANGVYTIDKGSNDGFAKGTMLAGKESYLVVTDVKDTSATIALLYKLPKWAPKMGEVVSPLFGPFFFRQNIAELNLID